jgi:hypothetical protein
MNGKGSINGRSSINWEGLHEWEGLREWECCMNGKGTALGVPQHPVLYAASAAEFGLLNFQIDFGAIHCVERSP